MIRHLNPRVAPPTDRPVQWFYQDGGSVIAQSGHRAPVDVVAWCIPATLTEPSGPVRSLEPEELPELAKEVQVRVGGKSGHWFPGWHTSSGNWIALCPLGGHEVVRPDAWRPLPDDEPGDAELLEAARKVTEVCGLWSPGETAALMTLHAIVEKRSGKDGGK